MSMIRIQNKQECCGCNACVQRCPKNCISMHEDEEGFLYPKVDTDLCINCGLCEKVCPVINQAGPRKPIATYAATNPDEKIRMASSSGGVFSAIAEEIIREGGVVFGARFDDKWEVEHAYTETIEGLEAFRGSKYVQSQIGDNFLRAEEFLKAGRQVLFSGTPCQIAGLKRFLRKEYPNLLTVDVVCHGVPSPLVWREYLKYILQQQANPERFLRPQANSGRFLRPAAEAKNTVCQSALKDDNMPVITGISFRDKRISWEKFGLSVRSVAAASRDQNSVCQSGKSSDCCRAEHDSFTTLDRDLYMQIFLKNLALRPSCYACPAKSGKSESDITLADFWGILRLNRSLYNPQGVSLVLANTEIGLQLMKSLNIETQSIAYESGLRFNPAIDRSASEPRFRHEFWECFLSGGMNKTEVFMLKFRPSKIDRMKTKIKESLKKILLK